jgi:hypothetical protein
VLPVDDRWFAVWFAQFPVARFDSRHSRMALLAGATDFCNRLQEEGGNFPFPYTPSPNGRRSKTVIDVPVRTGSVDGSSVPRACSHYKLLVANPV